MNMKRTRFWAMISLTMKLNKRYCSCLSKTHYAPLRAMPAHPDNVSLTNTLFSYSRTLFAWSRYVLVWIRFNTNWVVLNLIRRLLRVQRISLLLSPRVTYKCVTYNHPLSLYFVCWGKWASLFIRLHTITSDLAFWSVSNSFCRELFTL